MDFKIDYKAMNDKVVQFIKMEITIPEIANEFDISRNFVYVIFKEKFYPNPIVQREKFSESIYLKVGEMIESGLTSEFILLNYPMLVDETKIKRLIKEGKIKTRQKLINKRIGKELILKEQIENRIKKWQDATTIINELDISLNKLNYVLRKNYHSTSIELIRNELLDKSK